MDAIRFILIHLTFYLSRVNSEQALFSSSDLIIQSWAENVNMTVDKGNGTETRYTGLIQTVQFVSLVPVDQSQEQSLVNVNPFSIQISISQGDQGNVSPIGIPNVQNQGIPYNTTQSNNASANINQATSYNFPSASQNFQTDNSIPIIPSGPAGNSSPDTNPSNPMGPNSQLSAHGHLPADHMSNKFNAPNSAPGTFSTVQSVPPEPPTNQLSPPVTMPVNNHSSNPVMNQDNGIPNHIPEKFSSKVPNSRKPNHVHGPNPEKYTGQENSGWNSMIPSAIGYSKGNSITGNPTGDDNSHEDYVQPLYTSAPEGTPLVMQPQGSIKNIAMSPTQSTITFTLPNTTDKQWSSTNNSESLSQSYTLLTTLNNSTPISSFNITPSIPGSPNLQLGNVTNVYGLLQALQNGTQNTVQPLLQNAFNMSSDLAALQQQAMNILNNNNGSIQLDLDELQKNVLNMLNNACNSPNSNPANVTGPGTGMGDSNKYVTTPTSLPNITTTTEIPSMMSTGSADNETSTTGAGDLDSIDSSENSSNTVQVPSMVTLLVFILPIIWRI